jgi:CDP-diacylglycerol---serine O-phosphatidyltransferase
MKNHIPNFITCLNLFAGCVAILLAFKGDHENAFIAIMLSAVFDFFDGFASRLLKAYSDMGKELDSLADVISFGMAPGAIVFSLLSKTTSCEWLPYLAFLIPIFSGLRLAKFNVDNRQTTSFIGLPVPANAIFWAGMVFSFSTFLQDNVWLSLILIGLFCYFLISEIPMFSLKFKNLTWKDNQTQFSFLIICAIILIIFRLNAFPLLVAWYILLSVGISFFKKSIALNQ